MKKFIRENLSQSESELYSEITNISNLSDYYIAPLIIAYRTGEYDYDKIIDIVNRDWVEDCDGDVLIGNSLIYSVFEDYNTARNVAKEYIIDDAEDNLEYFDESTLKSFADEDIFRDALVESFRFYAEDIIQESSSTFNNRLVEECYDNDLINDDDFETDESGEIDYTRCTIDDYVLVDMYVEWYEASEYDWVGRYIDEFGMRDFTVFCKKQNAFDYDEFAEYCIDVDGVGHFLSNWDGSQYEVTLNSKTYYIYRQS